MADFFGRNFKKECPSGILDKGKVHKIYEQKLLPHSDSKFLVDQLFRIIDDDNNGGIDFKVKVRDRKRREPDIGFHSGVPTGCRYGRQWLVGGETSMDVQVCCSLISDGLIVISSDYMTRMTLGSLTWRR